MKRARKHLTFANVVSLMALIFSMSGGALAARHLLHTTHHYVINSTSQINPKVLKKLKGAAGEIGPIGPQGPTGETGPKGTNGGRGEPAPSILGSGETESGDFGIRSSSETGTLAETLTLRVPLAVVITSVEATTAAKPSGANCKGPGQAAKGYLCIYPTVEKSTEVLPVVNPESNPPVAGTGHLGFGVEVKVTGAEPAYEGTYSLTAP
jgi:hypothetical protein